MIRSKQFILLEVVKLKKDKLLIANKKFSSRLIVGTGKYKNFKVINNDPNGKNINDNVGALHVDKLLKKITNVPIKYNESNIEETTALSKYVFRMY